MKRSKKQSLIVLKKKQEELEIKLEVLEPIWDWFVESITDQTIFDVQNISMQSTKIFNQIKSIKAELIENFNTQTSIRKKSL